MAPPEDLEDLDPGRARERTGLAWTRTAIAFGAVGAAVLKTNIAAGLTVVGLSVVIWTVSRFFPDPAGSDVRPRQLLLVTMTVVAVALVALAVVLLGHPSSGVHAPKG